MNFKQSTGKSIKEAFEIFDNENPHVFAAFKKQALNAISNGRKKLSAKLIINWIRWNAIVQTKAEDFKINDAYQSYYARKFVKLNPEFENYFEFRTLRNEVA